MKKRAKSRTRNVGGRPTKYDAEIAMRIVELVRAGNYMTTAADAAGISRETLYKWIKYSEEGDPEYGGFSDTLKKAAGAAEAADLDKIGAASETQWQAAAWRLERKFPDRWGRREHHEITGAKGGPVQVAAVNVDLSKLTDEEVRAYELAVRATQRLLDDGKGGKP